MTMIRAALAGLIIASAMGPVYAARTYDDADPDYHQLTDANDPVADFPWTIAGWVYPHTSATNYTCWYWGDAASVGHYYAIRVDGSVAGNPIKIVARGSGSEYTASTTAGFSSNTWYHFVAVFDANNSRTIYINDANEATGTDLVDFYPDVNCIALGGMRDASPGLYLDGRMEHVGWWQASLDSEDRSMLYDSLYAPSVVNDANLVAYWPLTETSPADNAVDADTGDFTLNQVSNPGIASGPDGIITSLDKTYQNIIFIN